MSLLQFSLGLNATNFLAGINAANVALKSIAVIGAAATGGIAAIGAQISRGAGLQDLSNRLRVSVDDLAKLQSAFEITGVSADQVTGIIGALQRTMGGFNELGEPAKDIFAGIGLSVEELKRLDTPAALEQIMGKLRGLNASAAANAAGKIFGRGNGGAVMQAAGDAEDFARALKDSAEEAAILQRAAPAFAAIADSMTRLRRVLATLAVGIAEKFVGAINVMKSAFASGGLTELISSGISAGFEKSFNFGVALFGSTEMWSGLINGGIGAFQLIGTAMLTAFEQPLIVIQAGMDYIAERAVSLMESITNPFGENSGFRSFDEILAERQNEGVNLFGTNPREMLGSALDTLKVAGGDIGKALAAAWNASGGPAQDAFREALAQHQANVSGGALNPLGTEDISGSGSIKSNKSGGTSGAAVDALTRIGFFSGGGLSDPAARTATNTATMVQQLRQLVAQTKKGNFNDAAFFAGR